MTTSNNKNTTNKNYNKNKRKNRKTKRHIGGASDEPPVDSNPNKNCLKNVPKLLLEAFINKIDPNSRELLEVRACKGSFGLKKLNKVNLSDLKYVVKNIDTINGY